MGVVGYQQRFEGDWKCVAVGGEEGREGKGGERGGCP